MLNTSYYSNLSLVWLKLKPICPFWPNFFFSNSMQASHLTGRAAKRRCLKHFPIESYVKTMSTDGGPLWWRQGSSDTILKVDHPRTIQAMFALNWLNGFSEEDFSTFFPIGSYVKIMSAGESHLGWRSGSGDNSESWPPKDHPCHICLKLAYWFQGRFLKHFSHRVQC